MAVGNHWKTSMNVGALVTLVAGVHYFYMREFWVQIHASPILYRYIDWSITAPLQMIEFDLILNTISADIPVNRYLRLLKPRGVMAVVGLPPEKQEFSFGAVIGGAKAIAGSNIGGIAETQEMLDFCAEHGIAAQIETIPVTEADAAYDRVVAGDVRFRVVIDTATFDDVEAVA